MTFAGAEDRWLGMLGRLRDVVRQEVVAAQLRELLPAPTGLRVLDVGCGQGTQALALARDGHHVTGLDASARMLEHFARELDGEPADVRSRVTLVEGAGGSAPELTPGPFDVVLCHGVLMYLDDTQVRHLLAALTRVGAPGSVLSLLVRNGLAPAVRPALLRDWAGALAAFDTSDYVNRLGVAARAHTPADVAAVLEPLGWGGHAWFGVRVFTDHLDEQAPPAAELEPLLRAELEAGRRDPYRRVAALLHLVHVSGRAV